MIDGGASTGSGFRVPVLGMIGGFFGAIGVLLLFQQFEVLWPTRTMVIAFLIGGVLLNLIVANVVAAVTRRGASERAAVDEQRVYDPPAYDEPVVDHFAPYDRPTVITPTAVVAAEDPTVVLPTTPTDTPIDTPIDSPVDTPFDTPAWTATHVVPAAGLPAWTDPDPAAAPATRLDPGLDVAVDRREGDWAHVVCSNGWAAWVDGRLLEELIR